MTQVLRDNSKYFLWAIYVAAAVLLIAWLSPLVMEKAPYTIVQRTIGGVLLGGIYAIIALGIVVINKASGVFNFAHGAMMMFSAFIFYSFFTVNQINLVAATLLTVAAVTMVVTTASWNTLRNWRVLLGSVIAAVLLIFLMSFRQPGWAWINALTGAIVGTVLVGLLIERFSIRPLIGQPIFAAVMVTLALGEVLGGFTTLIWGSQPVGLTIFGMQNAFVPGQYTRINTPITIDTAALLGGPVNVDQPRLFAFLIALATFGAFFLFFRYTNIGLAMRATSEDQQLAESVGLRVRNILAVTWGIAALLAGIAGVLQIGASDSNALNTDLQYVALRAFPAVLLGGLESISGALIGGLILGLTEEWAKMLFNTDIASNLAPYVVLMVILVFRPEGLFGEKRIERI
ncbi:MAG: branched-chain amino acid ABC transporter permease [Anaerolineae bacterium]|nr:branched-chain amino acid ABC transporter permease [Anaerolineae bacterium]